MIVKDLNRLTGVRAIVEWDSTFLAQINVSLRATYAGVAPLLNSVGLYGVLKLGGLLPGSAFILDIEGVSIGPALRLLALANLFADPVRGVLGIRPSSLFKCELQ